MVEAKIRGRTFRNRIRFPEGTIDGPVRCKPIEPTDGSLLAGSSTEYDGWRVHFEKTQLENGIPQRSWKRIGPIRITKMNSTQFSQQSWNTQTDVCKPYVEPKRELSVQPFPRIREKRGLK